MKPASSCCRTYGARARSSWPPESTPNIWCITSRCTARNLCAGLSGEPDRLGEKMSNQFKYRLLLTGAALILTAAVLITTGCATTSSAANTAPPPDVEVAAVEQKDIPIEREWIGTLDGMVNAAIKAEVNGYLLRQNYAEGSFVYK